MRLSPAVPALRPRWARSPFRTMQRSLARQSIELMNPQTAALLRRAPLWLLSSQMYGTDGQYKTDNQLKVNITGGTLTSNQGNAVTVYNTEQNEVQTAAGYCFRRHIHGRKSRGHLRDQGRQHRDHQREYPDHQQVQHNIDGLRQRGSCLYRRRMASQLILLTSRRRLASLAPDATGKDTNLCFAIPQFPRM